MTKQPTGPEGTDQHRRDQIAADHHNLRVTIDQLLQVSELPLVIAQLRRLRTELSVPTKVYSRAQSPSRL